MCFSATASFTASVALAILGLLACKQVKHRAMLPLACSPFMFALQQASEGFLWLSLTNPSWQSLQAITTYIFLFFALAWWPFWVPCVLMMLEPHILQRRILINLLTFGGFFSLYMLFCLGSYGATASLMQGHMYYAVTIPGEMYTFLGFLYLIPAVMPFFVSSIWGMNILGSMFTISYAISYYFYSMCFLSTWCFFTALLSMMICIIVHHVERDE